MSKLVTTYAKTLGLDTLETPFLAEKFFPVDAEKYITLQSSSINQAAKCYDFWDEVVKILRKPLEEAGIKILQIGGESDIPVFGTIDLRGKTSLHQANYLVKRALAHVGVDSCWAHIAGASHIPIVALYGSTSVSAHGPYWYDQDNSVLLESHRFNNKPSYSMNESRKTINLIPPEDICQGVFRALGKLISNRTSAELKWDYQSLYFGERYKAESIELIPNMVPSPQFNPSLSVAVRLDKLFDENVLIQTMSLGRKVNIVTDKPLTQLGFYIQKKDQIESYSHEVKSGEDPQYFRTMMQIVPNCIFYTMERDEKKVESLRFEYLDIIEIYKVEDKKREDFIKKVREYRNDVDFNVEQFLNAGLVKYKSSKYILSKDQIYSSYSALKRGIPIHKEDGMYNVFAQVIDEDEFWKDLECSYFICDMRN